MALYAISYGGAALHNSTDAEPIDLVRVEADGPDSPVTRVEQIGSREADYGIVSDYVRTAESHGGHATVRGCAACYGASGMWRALTAA